MSLSGNIAGNKNTRGYIQGLKDRFGAVEAKEIFDHCLRAQGEVKKWTCEEVQKIKEDSMKIQKMLS